MSKNHPHDNIYSILGKLEALKPTTQEKHDATVKQIYESVEAQGSILKGLREVSSVETRLARQFAESDFSKMSAAIQKTGKSKASADAITAAAGREKLGQKEMTRRSVAGRKDESYNPVKAVKQCAKDYMEMNGIHSVHDLEAEDIESIGGDCQMNYQDVCEILGCNLPDSLGPVKSWDTDEHGNKFDLEEAYNPVKAVKQCAKSTMEMNGIASVHDLDAEDIEYIGDECQMNYHDVCEILGIQLPDSLGPVKSWDTDEHGNKFDLEEGVCNECGMMEGSCEHTMREGEFAGRSAKYGVCVVGHNGGKPVKMFDTEAEAEAYAKKGIRIDGKLLQGSVRTIVGEGEITHKGGEKVPTKFGTLHKSKATVDTEKDVMTDKLTDPDADDSEPAVAKGRGRPKMDIKDRSQAKMPWGGKPPKDTYKHQKGSTVHKMSDRAPKGSPEYVGETMADATIRLERKLLEGHMIDESGETLDHILNRFKHEVRNFKQTGELEYGSDLYDALYDYYCDSGEMPYGTAKARDGDPVEWISNNLQSHLDGGGIVGGNPPEDMGLEREGIEGRMPPVDNIPGKDDLLKGKGRSYYEEEATMRDELNELARLAGLNTSEGNAFTGKLKNTAKGDKFDLDGKEYTDTSTLDEEPEMEGNAFGKAVADAKADGIQPGEKVKVGDKEYPVKEARDLLQMMKIAGLDHSQLEEAIEKATKKDLDDMEAQDREHEFGTVPNETDSELEEGKIEVAEPDEEPVNNAHHGQYASMKASTLNPGEGDNGEKAMHGDKPTFKNGDNPLSKTAITPVKEATMNLEARLAAEYESIKKISK